MGQMPSLRVLSSALLLCVLTVGPVRASDKEIQAQLSELSAKLEPIIFGDDAPDKVRTLLTELHEKINAVKVGCDRQTIDKIMKQAKKLRAHIINVARLRRPKSMH